MEGIRQKHKKPLAVDARCLLQSIDAAAARKSSIKLGYFQSAPSSPPPGSCIHRKAINKNKPLSSGFFFYHGLNGLNGWDLIPFPRLTPLQPDGDVHPCKQACLPGPPHLSGLPLSDGKESSHGCFPEDRNPSDCFSIVLRGQVWHS